MTSKHPDRTVNLSVAERYALARLQPLQGNFVELTMSKNAITRLELQADEAERWGYIKVGEGRWEITPGIVDQADTLMADLTFSEQHFDRFVAQLRALAEDESAKAEMVHVRLYEKIVGPVDTPEDAAVRALLDDDREGPPIILTPDMKADGGMVDAPAPVRPERQFVDGQKQREAMEEGSPV
jgi:hypothetical protein